MIASTHAMEITPLKYDRNNDLDYATFERLLTEIDTNIKNGKVVSPEFIVILGDIAGHVRYSSESTVENEAMVFRVLKDIFPNTPIFYTFGNNDSLKANYGAFSDSERMEKSPYDIARQAGWANGFLSTGVICQEQSNYPCLLTENTSDGYYSAYLKPKLRLLSLNTVLFSPNRKTSEQEAFNQLQWLEKQLQKASMGQESVLITMHIPPGNNIIDHSNFWVSKEQAAFLKLINKYHQLIIGLLASHTHAEELRVIKDSSQNIIAGVYFSPGLSTSHGNEPSIKTVDLVNQDEHWQLVNYEVFHFSQDNTQLSFDKLYDYVNYYCSKEQRGIVECLGNVTAEKIDKYFAAGNKNYTGGMLHSPADIALVAPGIDVY
ncbi:metallophosphoesterase [Legionella jamestowniensis]|uniref:metallophosphoesterase n=1 Tax=Legionella jamestowniensis TaxID=455 RepID=UPI00114697C7|nr:metallophosphoesterase [Legionella jamestowniensis]